MNYTKPAVAVLGEAVSVIESRTQKNVTPKIDGGTFQLNPAYDLDE